MNGFFIKKEFLSGCAFGVFISAAFVMGIVYMRQTLSTLERPAADDLLRGKWPLHFERALDDALPVTLFSRQLWGQAEYLLFKEGRKGVVVGTEGWLFTDEEFSCPPGAKRNLADNLAFIEKIQKILAGKNSHLAVVLIPAKARVVDNHLGSNKPPSCRDMIYKDARSRLLQKGLSVTDLLPIMQASPLRETLYLKTDTHWSPAGARMAAQETEHLVRKEFKKAAFPIERFSSQAGALKKHEGDLARYIPGVPLAPEYFTSYVSGVSVASMDTKQDLFSESVPLVTLVGTSYSANPDWNFSGFLKEMLKTDVLNMADQGLGPFVVMDKYLRDDTWKNSPPRLVVWEVPERYLLMPHGVMGSGK